jgi:hypothetical protein
MRRFPCAVCAARLSAPWRSKGKPFTCPSCGATFKVPIGSDYVSGEQILIHLAWFAVVAGACLLWYLLARWLG